MLGKLLKVLFNLSKDAKKVFFKLLPNVLSVYMALIFRILLKIRRKPRFPLFFGSLEFSNWPRTAGRPYISSGKILAGREPNKNTLLKNFDEQRTTSGRKKFFYPPPKRYPFGGGVNKQIFHYSHYVLKRI